MAGILEMSPIGGSRRPGHGPAERPPGQVAVLLRGLFCRPFSGSLFWRTFLACSGAEGAAFWRISSMAGALETSSIGERRWPGPCWCAFFHCRGPCVGPCTHTLGFWIPGLDWQWDRVPVSTNMC